MSTENKIDPKYDIDYTNVNEIYGHYDFLLDGTYSMGELLKEAVNAVNLKYEHLDIEDGILYTIQRNVMSAFNQLQDEALERQRIEDEKVSFQRESKIRYEQLVKNYERNSRRTYKALYQTLNDIYEELSHDYKENVGFAFLSVMDAFKTFQENAKINK